MDAFIVKCDDAQSVILQQSDMKVKDNAEIREPPVKKIKHDIEENSAINATEKAIHGEKDDEEKKEKKNGGNVLEEKNNKENKEEDEVENQMQNEEENREQNGELDVSHDRDTSFDSVSSQTPSDKSPEKDIESNEEINAQDKEKVNSPKLKRRKLSNEEIEEKRKAKEQAKLAREQKRQEKLKRDQEKEELRSKREKERQAKKEQLEKERIEKQLKKEKLEKERLEKQKKKEELNLVKEEEKKKREEERKQKEEEKRLKEEERKKKDEERKKKEEEKRVKEEEEQRKKDKAKESFKSFFIKKSPPKKVAAVDEKCHMFAPFEVKPNMKLAPVIRGKPVDDILMFSEVVEKQQLTELYLHELKRRKSENKIKYVIGRAQRRKEVQKETCKNDDGDDVLIIENDENEEDSENSHIMHVKLLQFSENYRPPYYGTWRKRSKFISPRNPFKKDEELLSYEIDSDEEWEEEEPGESLSGPENEDEDDDEEDNDEENDGFFVPHGYLSDDEGINDSDGEKQEEKVDIRDKKLDKTEGFPFEGKGKVKQLRATCFGSAWFQSADSVPDFLAVFKITPMQTLPMDIFSIKEKPEQHIADGDLSKGGATPRSGNNTPLVVPDEAMPLLINFVHKNSFGLNKLITNFLEIWKKRRNQIGDDTVVQARISKRQLEKKILEIAKRDTACDSTKSCYIVHQHLLDQYRHELEELSQECTNVTGEQECRVSRTDLYNDVPISDAKEASISFSAHEAQNAPDFKENCTSSNLIDKERMSHTEEIKSNPIQREIVII